MGLNRARRRAVFSWQILSLAVVCAMLPGKSASAQRDPRSVRLVVYIVIDQFRADYLTRFREQMVPGGFRRLMDNGAHFANAHFSYGYSTTAPGHATIATGRNPRFHGIVANAWYQGRPNPAMKAAVYDPAVSMLVDEGGNKEGRSPRNLEGAALPDQLKLAHRRSRAFTVSMKDRAAILLGGRQANGAFWFDVNIGHFVTSDWYMAELPTYVREFNTHRWVDRFINNKWDRLLPPGAYEGTWPLDPQSMPNTAGLGQAFPHILPRPSAQPDRAFYTAIYSSPFGHETVLEMARRILAAERLGTGEGIDFLGVSFSSFDAAGHIFGPESAEMMDFTLRTDRQIAAFLDLLDRSVGLNRCIVVLTGDHGVSSAPRVMEQARLSGGLMDPGALIKEINASLGGIAPLPENRGMIASADLPWIRLDPAYGNLDGETQARVLAAARNGLARAGGVYGVYTLEDLSGPAPSPTDGRRLRAWNCYFPGRSGELYVDFGSHWTAKGARHAGHNDGSDHSRHVPIVIMGGGMRPGRYFTPADPADISVTVAALLGIVAPQDATGRVLTEAIDAEAFVR